jgi:hypothetical protein
MTMKRFWAVSALFAVLASVQALVPMGRLWGLATTPVNLTVMMPDGTMKMVCLDGMVLDTSGPYPVLRFPNVAGRCRRVNSRAVTATTQDVTLEDANPQDLDLAWNGLLLSEGIDYTLTGNIVHLNRPMIAGDTFRAVYFVAAP